METQETKSADSVRCSEWVGEAPPATPESEGWWWVVDGRYAPEPEPAKVWIGQAGLTVWQWGEESPSLVRDCGHLRWGGRLAVTGASPTGELCERRGKERGS